jgi:hypothetical protein
MAGASLGPILNAVANVTSLMSKPKSLKSFLETMNDYGVQVKNNFEVNFSGLEFVTFFLTQITLPGVKQNYIDVPYDAKVVKLPVNYDFDKSFSMTVICDAQGYLYSAISQLVMNAGVDKLVNSGYTMIVKGLTGDEKNYNGIQFTIRGVRFESISGLSFGSSDNAIQTFTVNCNCIDFSVTSNGLGGTIQNVMGAANALLG